MASSIDRGSFRFELQRAEESENAGPIGVHPALAHQT
jgi:hypothetical protein